MSVDKSAVPSTTEKADRGASSSKFGLRLGRSEALVAADCHGSCGSCTEALADFCIIENDEDGQFKLELRMIL